MTKGDSSSDLHLPSAASASTRTAIPVPPPLDGDDGPRAGSDLVKPPPLPEPAAATRSDEEPPRNDAVEAALREDEAADNSNELEAELRGNGRQTWGVFRNTEAFMGSIFVHLVLLVGLAIWMLPEVVHEVTTVIVVDARSTDEDALERLSQEALETASASISMLSTDSMSGVAGSATGLISAPSLDQGLVEKLSSSGSGLAISIPLDRAPSAMRLIEATPYSTLGDARAIVADYDDAFDRITQEIFWMLANSNVLVTWCFDQSESMKDDQQEIRSRIRHVYSELGLVGQTNNDALMTAVTSYGQGYLQHTKRPTSNVEEIEAAMDTVPVDPSGKEFMCQAITLSIAQHLKYVKQGQRQMALIVVTDESGERKGNLELLEQAIATARDAKCRIFVLGREAVFGYPYAHMKWKHPFTGHVH